MTKSKALSKNILIYEITPKIEQKCSIIVKFKNAKEEL